MHLSSLLLWTPHPHLARLLLAIFCCLQAAGTIALDLNRTHAAHPRWLGHARFHVVWQTASVAILSSFAAFLAIHAGALERERFYLAAILAAIPMAGFFLALAFRQVYGGTLSDPQGIPPLVLTLRGKPLRIDMNTVVEVAGILAVIVIVLLYQGN